MGCVSGILVACQSPGIVCCSKVRRVSGQLTKFPPSSSPRRKVLVCTDSPHTQYLEVGKPAGWRVSTCGCLKENLQRPEKEKRLTALTGVMP